jgi:putative spermidine/putrescine transport system permease protein
MTPGHRTWRWLPMAYLGIVFAYLLFPLLVVVPLSFGDEDLLRFPPRAWSLRWYDAYFGDPQWMRATALSFQVAISASLLATLCGTMAALALERRRVPAAGAVRMLITAPMIVPHIFLAVGVFVLAVRFGVAGSVVTLVCAHATIALPFVVLMVGAALRQIDPTLERAARVLGASPFRAFLTATLPGLLPAIVAAAIFSFFVSFDELIIAEFLMQGRETLPMRIWADLKLQLNPTVSAVSSLLIVVTLLALGVAEWLRRRTDTHNPTSRAA